MAADFKEQVLQAVPIESYIGRYTALRKAGKTYKGLCPFHKEKTPSFTVNPERGLFHCFGCGKGGDLIAFAMEMDRSTFPEALDTLARFAGIERPKSTQGNDPRERLFATNRTASKCFTDFLQSDQGVEARRYMSERGIGAEMAARYELGASPRQWDWLSQMLVERRDEALELGLLRRNERGDVYDFFRGRLMFPIHDAAGRLAAFGGRILPGDESPAKYVNSPESPVFHKGRTLYGLHQAAAAIRTRGECLFVEGYLDVIGLAQAGLGYVVAPLGTAVTAEHLALAARYAQRQIAIFDGDRAGRSAALRFARLALGAGYTEAFAILLPPGKDPFDLSQQLRPADWDQLLAARVRVDALLLLEWLFPDLAATLAPENLTPPEYAAFVAELYAGQRLDLLPAGLERRSALDRLFRSAAELERESDRLLMLDAGARLLTLDGSEVRREFGAQHAASLRSRPGGNSVAPSAGPAPAAEEGSRPAAASVDPAMSRVERALVAELVWAPAAAAELSAELKGLELEDSLAERVWRHLEMRLLTGQLWPAGDLRRLELPADALALFSGEGMQRDSKSEPDRAVAALRELLRHRSILALKKNVGELDRRYIVADLVERAQIMEERNRLLKELKALEFGRRSVGPL
ncbi:MAG: DNA primase [Leptospirales bacterium]|nr:DNA primase [Leptospirales bacterium]